jgi:HPt (histidine-containing phosphotransfer) domain-containing protein
MNPEPPNSAQDGVRIDYEKLAQLHELLAEAFEPLISSFRSNANLYVSQIEGAISDSRLDEATAVAHKLKSSAAQLGLPDLAKAAEMVEKRDPTEHIAALRSEQIRVCAVLGDAAKAVMSR